MKNETGQPEHRPERTDAPSGAASRRRYAAPVLTEYGSISRLTRTNGSTNTEFGVPRMKKNCL